MPVGGLDLPALVLDFRNNRAFWIAKTDWVAKVFGKLDHFGAKLAGRFSPHDQGADDAVLTQQRNGKLARKPKRSSNSRIRGA